MLGVGARRRDQWFEREVDAMKAEMQNRDDQCNAQRERAVAANEAVRVCMERHAIIYNGLLAGYASRVCVGGQGVRMCDRLPLWNACIPASRRRIH